MRKHSIVSRLIFVHVWAVFLLAIFGGTIALGSGGASGSKEEIQKIEERLSSEKARLEAFGLKEKRLLGELTSMEKEVARTRGAMETLNREARLNASEIQELRGDRNQLKQTVADIESGISSRLVGLYKYARKGYLKALVDVGDIAEFWRRVEYLDRVMKNERDALSKLADERRTQEAQLSTVSTRLDEVERDLRKEKSRLSTLNKELEDKVLQLSKIHREKEFLTSTVRDLQRASENMRQALLHIEDRKPSVRHSPERFVDHKGLLPFPIKGRIIKDETRLNDGGGGLYDGVFIEGLPGADVRAVFPGRVAFSGQVKGYGALIIVDHGSRFFTVSALLSRRDKSEGDVVAEGEILGAVSGSGSIAPGRLYFEVRQGGKPLDPLDWLKTR